MSPIHVTLHEKFTKPHHAHLRTHMVTMMLMMLMQNLDVRRCLLSAVFLTMVPVLSFHPPDYDFLLQNAPIGTQLQLCNTDSLSCDRLITITKHGKISPDIDIREF